MRRGRILVVDDEEAVRVTLAAVLSEAGHEVTPSGAVRDALARLEVAEFDVVLTDLRLDDGDGLRILDEVRRRWPDTVSLMLTGFASVESAIAALRNGAYDYLCKPFPPEDLLATVARALERRTLSLQVRHNMRDLDVAIQTARELHSALQTRVEGTTALLREREHVLTTVCTEVKTSLIAISGLAQLALGAEASESAGYLEKIRSETEKLAQRVNAALQITRTESVQVPADAPRAELLEISLTP